MAGELAGFFNLEFGISDLEFVSLKVYDIAGKEEMTSINETKPGGFCELHSAVSA